MASTINNIGGCMAIGSFAGILSGIWLGFVYHRYNFTRIDPLGIIGPIFICSIFGGFIVTPFLYLSYNNIEKKPLTLM